MRNKLDYRFSNGKKVRDCVARSRVKRIFAYLKNNNIEIKIYGTSKQKIVRFWTKRREFEIVISDYAGYFHARGY